MIYAFLMDDSSGRDPKATEAMYAKYKPTHVIHLAALGWTFRAYGGFLDLMPLIS